MKIVKGGDLASISDQGRQLLPKTDMKFNQLMLPILVSGLSLQVEIQAPETSDNFEYILSNRKDTHFSADIIKNESRKWHGLCTRGFTSMVNYWLDIVNLPQTTPRQVTGALVSPLRVKHTIQVDSVQYNETIMLPREIDGMIITYTSKTSFSAQFRPVFGFRKDWESEASNIITEFDKDLFLHTDNAKYLGPQVLGIRISGSTFKRKDLRVNRVYRRDADRGDVGNSRFAAEVGSLNTIVKAAEPLSVFVAYGSTKEKVQSLLDLIAKESESMQKDSEQKLEKVVKAGMISSDRPSFDTALTWALSQLDALTMNVNGPGIFAGIPWFNNYWGRDTFISFPGSLLVTNRAALQKEFILNMAQWQDKNDASDTYGRIPNILQPSDSTFENSYETVDGTLWWIRAIWYHLQYHGIDNAFLVQVWPNIEIAMAGHLTRSDSYGFLTHRPRETWMDAQWNGFIITPRSNRAVEVQALYFTALDIASRLALLVGKIDLSRQFQSRMSLLKSSFVKKYWNHQDCDLYDYLEASGKPNLQKRPNQAYAVTVPLADNPLLDDNQALCVLKSLVRNCVSDHGVRTLSENDPDYRPRHEMAPHHDLS